MYCVDKYTIMGDMKTQHAYKPMEFAQYFDKHNVHHAVTVLETHGESALVHYYTGIEVSDVVIDWVPINSLIPMIGA